MRYLKRNLIVASITFLVGVASVPIFNLFQSVGMLSLARVAPNLVFKSTGRGCGRGYVQHYRLLNGEVMAVGNTLYDTSAEARQEINARIALATSVVERVPWSRAGTGEEGEKIVLDFSNELGGKRASILWYNGGNSFLWIDAPSLDIALTFEKWKAFAN